MTKVTPMGKVMMDATTAAPSGVGRGGGAATPDTAEDLRLVSFMRSLTTI